VREESQEACVLFRVRLAGERACFAALAGRWANRAG
jgi:hypothetical protein